MPISLDQRKISEIEHGKYISGKAEAYWNWSTTVGIIRANRRAELLIYHGAISPRKKILEVGCGTGVFTEKLAPTNAEITALDISQELLESAKNKVKTKNVSFVLGDLENLDFADNKFDSAVGVSILHHVNLDTALKEIKRVVKNGGKIVFSEPNSLNPQIIIQEDIPPVRKFVEKIGIYSNYEKAFSRWTALKYLKANGFININITPFDWLHPFTPAFLIPAVEKMGNILEKTPIIKEIAGSLLIYAENNK